MRSIAILLINLELWVSIVSLPSCLASQSVSSPDFNIESSPESSPELIPQVATTSGALSSPGPSDTVATVARQVTVRVLAGSGSGSGVLVGHQGTTYLVLTCDHVVAASENDAYTVLTPDSKTYSARRLNLSRLADLDLALLSFESGDAYQIVTSGNSDNLPLGAAVYASGFPNYRFLDNQNRVESTEDLGTGAYQFTIGEFSMRLDRSLAGGYRLGYTNEVQQGMSGGPLLNASGQLVGVNGRLKHPLQGINAYAFTDGTLPSEGLFEQMETLSWAIPIASFQSTLDEARQQAMENHD